MRLSMNLPPYLRQRGVYEIVFGTLALWAVVYAVFMLPSGAAGKWAPWRFLVNFKIAACGPLISTMFYPALLATRTWSFVRRCALMGILVAVATGLHSLIDARIVVDARGVYVPDDHTWRFWPIVFDSLMIYTWLYGMYVAVLALMLSRYASQERDRQLAEARAATHQAQLEALRFQLNPHFLFNALNAISCLIVTGRNADAEAMIGKLSDFLRSSLASEPHSVIPLAEEVAAVRAYLDIETVRFGERMEVEVICPGPLADALAPSFVLQPLVENAVKYAVAPARRRVKILVKASTRENDLILVVEDDGDGHPPSSTAIGVGVGLENVRRRLQVLYGERGSIEVGKLPGGGFRAVLKFPLERVGPVAEIVQISSVA